MVKSVTLFLLVVSIFTVFSGCKPEEKETLYVYCDVILEPAITKLVSQFESKSDYSVQLIFGPEDRVFRRAKLSNHADVYIAITPKLIERAEKLDISKDQESICCIMPIMITVPLNPLKVKTLKDLDDADRKLGINNADTTLGNITKQLFEKNGFEWNEVREKVHYPSEEEAALIEAIQSSAIDVAFIWSMTAIEAERVESVPIDPKVNVYLPVVAMTLEKSEHPEVAADFVSFLKSPKIQKIWKKFGCKECASPDCTDQKDGE